MDDDQLGSLIDASVKALFRECPSVPLRLAGLHVAPESIRMEDANLNLPELRADHVFVVPDQEGSGERAIYMEYQLEPDSNLHDSWCAKWGGLKKQLKMPVNLLVIYLEKGDRAAFPNRIIDTSGPIVTELLFTAVRLWEHSDRIRSGELIELAPLLVLCERNPGQETIREEIALIGSSHLPVDTQTDMLRLALRLASRRIPRAILEPIFQEEFMITREPVIDEIVERWEARGREIGIEQGIEQGIEKGAVAEARKFARLVIVQRFGSIPDELAAHIEHADARWCEALAERAFVVTTVEELLAFDPANRIELN